MKSSTPAPSMICAPRESAESLSILCRPFVMDFASRVHRGL